MFRILGGVSVDGAAALRPQAGRILASLLVSRGRRVSTDQIEDIVWRGEPVDRGTIHTAVSRLRSALPPGLIERVDDGYKVDTSERGYDADLFGALLDDAERVSDPLAVIGLTQQALHLWSGPPFGSWGAEPGLARETVRLVDRHARALELLASSLISVGRFDEAATTLVATLTDHPFHDGLRGLHARALARAGRRVEAVRELSSYRRLLADETGLSPAPEIVALEDELIRLGDDVALTPKPVERVGPINDLPSVGIRRQERAVLARCIRDAARGASRFVVLSGDPGFGKSVLASEVRDLARAAGMRAIVGRSVTSSPVPLGSFGTLGREARSTTPEGGVVERRAQYVQALVARVEAAVAAGPLALIVEDAHWSDDASLDALAALHANFADADEPLLIVATTRPGGLDDVDRPELARLARDASVQHLALDALDLVEIDELAADELGGRPSSRLVHDLERISLDSPLMVRLLCDRLKAEGRVRPSEFGLAAEVGDAALPADLRSAYSTVFRSLREESRDLLLMGAVLGDGLSVTLLAEVVRRQMSEVIDALKPASALARVEGQQIRFDHDLARRAVLSELSGADRLARHALAAERLMTGLRPEDAPSERVVLVADQLQHAGVLADRQAVVDWSIAAGEVAESATLWVEAARHFRAAVDRGATGDIDLRLGSAQYLCSDVEATRQLRKAVTSAQTSGDLDREIDSAIAWQRAALREMKADVVESEREVLALLDRPLSRMQHLRVVSYLALFAVNRQDPRGEEWLEQVRACLLPGDPVSVWHDYHFASGLLHMAALRADDALSSFLKADGFPFAGKQGAARIRAAEVLVVFGRSEGVEGLLDHAFERELAGRHLQVELTYLYATRAQARLANGTEGALVDLANAVRLADMTGSRLGRNLVDLLVTWVRRERSVEIGPPPRSSLLRWLADRSPDGVAQVSPDRFPALRSAPNFFSLAQAALAAEVARVGGNQVRDQTIVFLEAASRRGVHSALGWPTPFLELAASLR